MPCISTIVSNAYCVKYLMGKNRKCDFHQHGEARSPEKSVFIRIFSALGPVNCRFQVYAIVTHREPSVDCASGGHLRMYRGERSQGKGEDHRVMIVPRIDGQKSLPEWQAL